MIQQTNSPAKSNCIEFPVSRGKQETAIRVSELGEAGMRIDLSVPGGCLSDDTLTAESLHRLLRQGAEDKREIILNLAGVDLEGSTVGELIRVDKAMREKGGELRVIGAGRPLLQLFDIAKLDSLKIEPLVGLSANPDSRELHDF